MKKKNYALLLHYEPNWVLWIPRGGVYVLCSNALSSGYTTEYVLSFGSNNSQNPPYIVNHKKTDHNKKTVSMPYSSYLHCCVHQEGHWCFVHCQPTSLEISVLVHSSLRPQGMLCSPSESNVENEILDHPPPPWSIYIIRQNWLHNLLNYIIF